VPWTLCWVHICAWEYNRYFSSSMFNRVPMTLINFYDVLVYFYDHVILQMFYRFLERFTLHVYSRLYMGNISSPRPQSQLGYRSAFLKCEQYMRTLTDDCGHTWVCCISLVPGAHNPTLPTPLLSTAATPASLLKFLAFFGSVYAMDYSLWPTYHNSCARTS
jgi:hypothetical protein